MTRGVEPENYSIITVLVMKKIAQNGSNWLHFSETNHACSENTEIHSENEGNNGVEPVSGPNKCKMVLGRNTETWKMRNPCDVAGKLGSDQMGGGWSADGCDGGCEQKSFFAGIF